MECTGILESLAVMSFLVMVVLQSISFADNTGLWFSTKTDEDSDITVSPAIPVEGEQAEIIFRIHNSEKTSSPESNLECYCNGELIGQKKISKLKANSEEVVSFPWQPVHNGIYKITGKLSIGGKQIAKANYEVAVVAKKLYLGWCDGSYHKSAKKLLGYCKWINLLTQVKNPNDIKYWKRRGAMLLLERKGELEILKKEGVKYWLSAADDKRYDGLAINEFNMDYFGEIDQQIFKYVDEFKKWKEKHPDYFVAAWHSGPLQEEFCKRYRGFADLVMIETYTNYFRGRFKERCDYRYIDERIDMARKMDWLDKAIMSPCTTVAYGGVTPDDLESQIRYIRQRAPEMPGLIYYCGRCTPPPLKKFADKLLFKYFIKPVITFWPENDVRLSDYRIAKGEKVEIITTLHNIGGIDSGKVTVNIYAQRISDGKREKIKTLTIDSLKAGDVKLERWPAKDIEPYVAFPGLRKKGTEFTNPAIPAKTVLKAEWKPSQIGTYKIEVEIVPAEDECLNPLGSKFLYVYNSR